MGIWTLILLNDHLKSRWEMGTHGFLINWAVVTINNTDGEWILKLNIHCIDDNGVCVYCNYKIYFSTQIGNTEIILDTFMEQSVMVLCVKTIDRVSLSGRIFPRVQMTCLVWPAMQIAVLESIDWLKISSWQSLQDLSHYLDKLETITMVF